MIAKDGEGATKLIEVSVSYANSETDAKICAKAVISSSLVKAAFFGSDANWGRILCAMGYSVQILTPKKNRYLLFKPRRHHTVSRKRDGDSFQRRKSIENTKEDHIIVARSI